MNRATCFARPRFGHALAGLHALHADDVGLGRFHEPVAVIAPEEFVEPLRRLAEPEILVRRLDGDLRVAQLALDVEHVGRGPVGDARAERQRGLLHLVEPGSVPDLVGEVAPLLHLLFIEADVLPLRRDPQQAEAHAVRAEPGDEVEHVGRVAERFAHLLALAVADQAGEIHVAERDVVRVGIGAPRLEFQSGNDHARHPEENDVRPGDEHVGRVKLRPGFRVHRFVGPQPGGEPGVQRVRVLGPAFAGGRGLHADFAVRSVPSRDAVAPPDLAADAPVLDVLQPLRVHLFPMLREKANQPVAHHGEGLGSFRITQEPLFAQARFDGHLGAFAETHVVLVCFLFGKQAHLHEHFSRLPARGETVQAVEFGHVGRVDRAVGVERVHHAEAVPLADLEVELVVCGRDFERAGAELEVHRRVSDDGDLRAGKRTPDGFCRRGPGSAGPPGLRPLPCPP